MTGASVGKNLQSRRRAASVLVALAAVLGGIPAAGASSSTTPETLAESSTVPTEGRRACTEPSKAFRPTQMVIPKIVGPTRVLARGRDRRGAPVPPPLTDRGRWQLAWDRDSGIKPGSSRGVVRMLAHTYPYSGVYGYALGNRLLNRLHVGKRLVVSGGEKGQRLCYRVTRRVKVKASASLAKFYTSGGRPKLAILVCSGVRRGPGNWSHRTIWFARPVT